MLASVNSGESLHNLTITSTKKVIANKNFLYSYILKTLLYSYIFKSINEFHVLTELRADIGSAKRNHNIIRDFYWSLI